MTKLLEIEGIGASYAQKLADHGVSTVEALLSSGSTPKGRQTLAEQTGISDKLLLRWINHADLFRIHGVGEEYADLLEAAGVDTVPELARRKAANLAEALEVCNKEKKRVNRVPSLSQVEKWIEEAKALPRAVEY